MRLPAIILLVVVAALSVPALAQTPAPAEKAAGGISREDYVKRAADRAAARFDRMDANHDGVLTREEIRAYRETHHRVRHRPAATPEPPPAPVPPKQQ